MKAALRDARVDAAVERAKKKPKRAVTHAPVAASKYPRVAWDSARLGTLVHGGAVPARKARASSSLPPRVKSPGQKRRAIQRWYRENVVGKLVIVSNARAQNKGTRTPERRKQIT